jgi:hypothetical protein
MVRRREGSAFLGGRVQSARATLDKAIIPIEKAALKGGNHRAGSDAVVTDSNLPVRAENQFPLAEAVRLVAERTDHDFLPVRPSCPEHWADSTKKRPRWGWVESQT